jgi:hypothetical protein
MNVSATLAAKVRQRAGLRCEYCQMSQSLQGASFHIEHILPRVHGGKTAMPNLALACPGCNLHKSDHTAAKDPATGAVVPLYHPRRDKWDEHFEWAGVQLKALTPSGRATIKQLQLNHPRRLMIRRAESNFGLFPPA